MSRDFIRAAVIGHPVAHSLSPLIHNHWIGAYGLFGEYKAVDVAPEKLAAELPRLCTEEEYRGFSVTIPHKQAVMALCGELDESARAVGAVNTLTADADGKLTGYNTDASGFIGSVREAAPDFNFARGPVLVLGGGGAARAVVYGLKQAGARNIVVCNRTQDKADEIAGAFGVESAPWEERMDAAENAALLVNTTALGMKGQPPLIFDTDALPDDALVCDIVYNPRRTDLLRAAEAAGLETVEGLGMLLHQARPAFARWFGVTPEVTAELREKIQKALP